MEEKKKKERSAGGTVTRLEFYSCMVLLIVLMLWLNLAAEQRMSKIVMDMADRADQMELVVSRHAGDIMDNVRRTAEEMERRREYILISHSMQVIGVNHKTGTVRLALSANPKEYSEGMEGTFYVGRDEIEEYVVPGVFNAEGILCAEIELPLCKWVNASVGLRTGDNEKRQSMGEMEITESMTMPGFEGRWKEFSHDTENETDTLTGVMEIEADFPEEWGDRVTLRNCMLEVQMDGKTIQTVPMESAAIDPEAIPRQKPKFHGRIEEPVLLEEGCDIAFFFKAEDGDGAKYIYLVQEGTLDAKTGRYIVRKAVEGADLNGQKLTIE